MSHTVTMLRQSETENFKSDSELIKQIRKKIYYKGCKTLSVVYFLIFTKCRKQEQNNMIHLFKKTNTITNLLEFSDTNTIIKYIFVDTVFFEIRDFDSHKYVINFKEEAFLPHEYLNNVRSLETTGKLKAHFIFLIDEAHHSAETLNFVSIPLIDNKHEFR